LFGFNLFDQAKITCCYPRGIRSLRVYLIGWANEYFTIVLDLPLKMVFGTDEFLATVYYPQVEW
jgi:hypothetical protein